jgi:predicted metal-dependent phosphoesterase TrpH
MKRITVLILALLAGSAAFAQNHYYQDPKNSEMLRHGKRRLSVRKEVALPQVNGYNVYKADLHTHTIYSDGQVLPKFRVREAWRDGLDVMAVTEHIEHRPVEETMVNYLEKYVDDKYPKAKNNRIGGKYFPDEDGIMVDLNSSVKEAQAAAKQYGLTIIPGSEITRSGNKVGHFNALFTTDNNTIYDDDPLTSIRNAKAQGALVMHNHPGWTKTSLNYTEVEKAAYDEGLIDGVEVVNGMEFYPKCIERAQEKGLFVSANTDEHTATSFDFGSQGYLRPMTLILAKDKSLEALREALEAKRTLALAFDNLSGNEQLLKDFFTASFRTEQVSVDKKGVATVLVTNCTSVSYVVKLPDGMIIPLDSFTTVSLTSAPKAQALKFEVLNMWTGVDIHPTVELQFLFIK